MQSEGRFIAWWHQAERAEQAWVFPDGCRDILIFRGVNNRSEILLTGLDFWPRTVALPAGARIIGYRLRPGATVSSRALEAIRAHADRAETIIGEECGDHNDLDDAIDALAAPGATVEAAALQLGVSVRSLQRHFRMQEQPPPDFWRLLARARRAAGMLASCAPIAEIADECGFSDQAHMTREMARWFSVSPGSLRRTPLAIDLLRQPALGNWTAEQISTR